MTNDTKSDYYYPFINTLVNGGFDYAQPPCAQVVERSRNHRLPKIIYQK